MIEITREQVEKELIAVILENPTRVVTECRYTYEDNEHLGEPCCIVGTVLYRLGCPIPKVNDMVKSGPKINGSLVRLNSLSFDQAAMRSWYLDHGVQFSDDAVEMLRTAQRIQDAPTGVEEWEGTPWIEILKRMGNIKLNVS